ncbi:PTS system, N-acetylglucosamine-specific IIA component / PTS system, N-acetylglucosamine-specific IIB component / PTS system, N-acetylglucosamine-specific IIC component [Clostridiaceae bacterium JG1575]|nr:PTS system, N-acetylglucosamine-specific IIA component / PTS system, N-acetylglucosamine-specific IIB component / PTS system, N-acetylglucosamine-specific IIC component [Clostridiaceae bacterium JG1575]
MKRFLQKLGKSFMLPVAILPVVSILFGIGYSIDFKGWGANNLVAAFLIRAGLAIIDNIPLLFAVGIPVGLSKERDGAAALSGLAGFLVVRNLLNADAIALYQKINVKDVPLAFTKIDNVFIGILVGIMVAYLYNRFSRTELPAALSFFSGRRLVPIMTVFCSILLAVVLYFVWPLVFGALIALGENIVKAGAAGAGIYGFFNRLLIPTGLHHALNAVFWFDTIGIGDLNKFWANEGVRGITGMYMGGFFPIMMFGLPGAALAMYHTAKKDRKQVVGSMLLGGAIAAFVTGLTEPLEFLFMFLSPLLYLVHAVLTGISLAIAAAFHWTAGFTFSAGLIDLIFSSRVPIANQPFMLVIMGLIFFALYYFVFKFFILKFNLKTPGREDEYVEYRDIAGDDHAPTAPSNEGAALTAYDKMAQNIYQGLGGKENIVSFDYCATRIRTEVKDTARIDQKKIKEAGAVNILINGKENAQVIIGPKVQFVVDAMHKIHGA